MNAIRFPHLVAMIVVPICLVSGVSPMAQDQWTVTSPDGNLAMSVCLQAPAAVSGYPADKIRLYYSVTHRAGERSTAVVLLSPLGIECDDQAFVDDLRFEIGRRDGHDRRDVFHAARQAEDLPEPRAPADAHLPQSPRRDPANRDPSSQQRSRLSLCLPRPRTGLRRVRAELTGVRVAESAVGWMTPFQEPGKYTPAYESDYLAEIAVGTPSPTNGRLGVSRPVP